MEYTLAGNGRREKVINKSRFICTLRKVASEDEAQNFIKEMKKKYWDATHNCSAYIIDSAHMRSNDDGEPSGTAGVPMLEVLKQQSLVGVAVVVTRYFGGIKLGAGGLVRAYSSSVADALNAVGLAKRIQLCVYAFHANLSDSGKIANILYRQKLFELADVQYGTLATFSIRLQENDLQKAKAWLTNALQCNVSLTLKRKEFAEVPLKN